MSKKKTGKTLPLKEFHGGSIPSSLPLPSAPGMSVGPPQAYYSPFSGGASMAPKYGSGQRFGNNDAWGGGSSDIGHLSFSPNTARIGRNYDEDERKPVEPTGAPRYLDRPGHHRDEGSYSLTGMGGGSPKHMAPAGAPYALSSRLVDPPQRLAVPAPSTVAGSAPMAVPDYPSDWRMKSNEHDHGFPPPPDHGSDPRAPYFSQDSFSHSSPPMSGNVHRDVMFSPPSAGGYSSGPPAGGTPQGNSYRLPPWQDSHAGVTPPPPLAQSVGVRPGAAPPSYSGWADAGRSFRGPGADGGAPRTSALVSGGGGQWAGGPGLGQARPMEMSAVTAPSMPRGGSPGSEQWKAAWEGLQPPKQEIRSSLISAPSNEGPRGGLSQEDGARGLGPGEVGGRGVSSLPSYREEEEMGLEGMEVGRGGGGGDRPRLKLLPRSTGSTTPVGEERGDVKGGSWAPRTGTSNGYEDRIVHGGGGGGGALPSHIGENAQGSGEGEEERRERPRLKLQPRSKPVASSLINDKDGSEQSRRSVFGGAAPRELVLKGRGLNEAEIVAVDAGEPKVPPPPRTSVPNGQPSDRPPHDRERGSSGDWEQRPPSSNARDDRERGAASSSLARAPPADGAGGGRRESDRWQDSWRRKEDPHLSGGVGHGYAPGSPGLASALVDPPSRGGGYSAGGAGGGNRGSVTSPSPVASPLELAEAFSRANVLGSGGYVRTSSLGSSSLLTQQSGGRRGGGGGETRGGGGYAAPPSPASKLVHSASAPFSRLTNGPGTGGEWSGSRSSRFQ